jgi:hypothetical protein
MSKLKKGHEPNSLQILVDTIDLKPFAKMRNGMIEDGIVIKCSRYNLEDMLIQMLDDYGKKELIKRLDALD